MKIKIEIKVKNLHFVLFCSLKLIGKKISKKREKKLIYFQGYLKIGIQINSNSIEFNLI